MNKLIHRIKCWLGHHEGELVGPIPGFHWNIVATKCRWCGLPGMDFLDEDQAEKLRSRPFSYSSNVIYK